MAGLFEKDIRILMPKKESSFTIPCTICIYWIFTGWYIYSVISTYAYDNCYDRNHII